MLIYQGGTAVLTPQIPRVIFATLCQSCILNSSWIQLETLPTKALAAIPAHLEQQQPPRSHTSLSLTLQLELFLFLRVNGRKEKGTEYKV